MLGLRFCARALSSCSERGPLFIAVRGPLTVAASLVAEHRLQTRRLSSCGSRAQSLRGMWKLPRPGLEPVSPALAGRFSTTAPPGKPLKCSFLNGRKFSANEVHKDHSLVHSVSLGRHRYCQQLGSENLPCSQPFHGCPADLGLGRSKDMSIW